MKHSTSARNSRRAFLSLLAAAPVFLGGGGNAVAESPKEVTVVGTVDAVVVDMPPVAVHSLDDPALTAFQGSGAVTVVDGLVGALGEPIAEVPEGTRLVIEYVSVHCDTPVGNTVGVASLGAVERTSPTSTITREFQIPLNDQGAGGFSASNFVGALSTRIYSDRGFFGGGVTGNVLRASGTGETTCDFSIAGHTVALGPSPAGSATAEAQASATGTQEELIVPYTVGVPLEALQPPDGTVVKLLAP